MPRWLAILAIYARRRRRSSSSSACWSFRRSSRRASTLWAKLPSEFNRLQHVPDRPRPDGPRASRSKQAVQNAPTGSGGNAVGTVLVAISSVIGGIFGLITVVILTFYLLIEAGAMFEYLVRFVPRGPARRRRASRRAQGGCEGQRVAACAVRPGGVMGTFAAVGTRADGRAVLLCHRAHRRGRRNDSDRRARSSAALAAVGGRDHRVAKARADGRRSTSWSSTSSRRTSSCPKIMERSVGVSPVGSADRAVDWRRVVGLVGAILAIPTVAILSVIVEELAVAQDAALRHDRSM